MNRLLKRLCSLFSTRSNRTANELKFEFSADLAASTERLEDRAMLAGNVQAILTAAGDLRIIGDNNDNAVAITKAPSGQLVVIGGGTTINGQVGSVELPANLVPDDLIITMRGGNDLVEITNIGILGDLRANMGTGDDTLGVKSVGIQHRTIAIGGAGSDMFSFVGSIHGKDFRSIMGGGDDLVYFADCGEVLGNTTIIAGGGNDEGIFIGGRHEGRVTINTGGGSDGVYVGTMQLPLASITRIILGGGGLGDLAVFTSTSLPHEGVVVGGGGPDLVVTAPGAAFGMTTPGVETLQPNDPDANTAAINAVLAFQNIHTNRGGSLATVLC